jgi:hypothetical protein
VFLARRFYGDFDVLTEADKELVAGFQDRDFLSFF